jgi:hypothetical protein
MTHRVISLAALLLMVGCGLGTPCKSTDGSGDSCTSSAPTSPSFPDPRSCIGAFYCGTTCRDANCKTACFSQVSPAQKEALGNLDRCAVAQCAGKGDLCDAFQVSYDPALCYECAGAVVQNQHGTQDSCKSFLTACPSTL